VIVDKVQPELADIIEAISRWIAVNEGRVSFVGSFVAFDEDMNIKEEAERIFAYGDKEILLIQLNELKKEIKKDKNEFVNW